MMPIVQTVNLKKYYQQGGNVVKALDGVSLESLARYRPIPIPSVLCTSGAL